MTTAAYLPVLLSLAVNQSHGDILALETFLRKIPSVSLEEVLQMPVTQAFDHAYKHQHTLNAPVSHHWVLAHIERSVHCDHEMIATFKHPTMETWVEVSIPMSHIPPKHQTSSALFQAYLNCGLSIDGSIRSYFVSDIPPEVARTTSGYLPPEPDDFSNAAQVEDYKKQLELLLGAPVKPEWL